MAVPDPTDRLRFRQMRPTDLDDLAALLGDPIVMTFYPTPMTRDEAAGWITWNQDNYRRYGFGLWILQSHDRAFPTIACCSSRSRPAPAT